MEDVDGGASPGARDFETFYETHVQSVGRAVALSFGDLDVAQQATDEAFARALERWARVARRAPPAGVTRRVALNCARRTAKAAARRRATEASLQPDEAFEEHPDLLAFHERVAELPERQRIAVVLRFVADLTEQEIADVMRVRRGTVSATLRTAMQTLQPSVAPDPTDQPSPGVPHA